MRERLPHPDAMEHLNRVREARLAVGMKLAALADAAEMTEDALRHVERGGTRPHVYAALRMAAALGVDVMELFATPATATRTLRRYLVQTVVVGAEHREAIAAALREAGYGIEARHHGIAAVRDWRPEDGEPGALGRYERPRPDAGVLAIAADVDGHRRRVDTKIVTVAEALDGER